MRGWLSASLAMLAVTCVATLLGGCAATGAAHQDDERRAQESRGQIGLGEEGEPAAEAVVVADRLIYPPGPWEREREMKVNGRTLVERSLASEPDAQGRWTVQVSQRPVKAGTEGAWTAVQSLVVSRSEAGTLLHELTNAARATRATFTPGLVVCPAALTPAVHEASSDVRSAGLQDERDVRTGKARATARAVRTAAGEVEVELTLEMVLGPATISRRAVSRLREDQVTSERSELVVKGGPFVLQREKRETTGTLRP